MEPFSIKHDYVELDVNDVDGFKVAKINNPIVSCDPGRNATDLIHTDYDMVSGEGHQPQEANGKVLFTYDVTWVEAKSKVIAVPSPWPQLEHFQ